MMVCVSMSNSSTLFEVTESSISLVTQVGEHNRIIMFPSWDHLAQACIIGIRLVPIVTYHIPKPPRSCKLSSSVVSRLCTVPYWFVKWPASVKDYLGHGVVLAKRIRGLEPVFLTIFFSRHRLAGWCR
jgi:hypothetical protein